MTSYALVSFVDGDRIGLGETEGLQPEVGATAMLRWHVEGGVRSVLVRMVSATESTWKVEALGEVAHVQRRDSVRMHTAVPVLMSNTAADDASQLIGKTIDLSFGGMAVRLDTPAETLLDQEIRVELSLPNATLSMKCRVMMESCASAEGHTLRMVFTEIPGGGERRLAEHLVQIQREELAQRRRLE